MSSSPLSFPPCLSHTHILSLCLTSFLECIVYKVSGLAEVRTNVETRHIHRWDSHKLEVLEFGVVGGVGADVAIVGGVVGALGRVQHVGDTEVLQLVGGQRCVSVWKIKSVSNR